MESLFKQNHQPKFHRLKITKKKQLTKKVFALELEIPENLKSTFVFEAGQYVPVRYKHHQQWYVNDYSITSAPQENVFSLGIKINSEDSSTNSLSEDYKVGDWLEVGEPKGRFTLISKPHEFRTILGFASGIGITPILSHFKNILYQEPRTRLFLFYGNTNKDETAYRARWDELQEQNADRLQVHYFYSKEKTGNHLTEGRLDDKKLNLIINQILHLDDTDEESTIWDAVDEVLICGKGEMIKAIANACYDNGIPKKNIHFELFEEYNDDIYPVETQLPLVENINVEFLYNGETHNTVLENNEHKLLQSLSVKGYSLPFSCKSGICGSCECRLVEGEVELLENEYLTEKEETKGRILACMSFPLTDNIKLDFDHF